MGARILVLHGPNLNLLGTRQPEVYGRQTLVDVDDGLARHASANGCTLATEQHNSEGGLVDAIQAARGRFDAIVINPAAYTHTSIAIRDALIAVDIPAFEVHISNVHARESFRHHSTIADVVVGRLMGFGAFGYMLALDGALHHLKSAPTVQK